MGNEEFTYLQINKLAESPTNPRRTYDEVALADLAESIKIQGVLQPLLVRFKQRSECLNYLPSDPTHEIVFGSRRYRAAVMAGLDQVPVRVKDLTDIEVLEIQVVENLQRDDVHPLDEALGYRALMKKAKHSVADIAAKVGKSESYIYQRLKLCELIKLAQTAFLKDQLTAGHAVQIARLAPADQKEALDYCLPSYKKGELDAGTRELARWIAQEVHRDLNKAPFDTGDPDLLRSAKACAECPKRSGFAPALFPDIKEKDTCTDRSCWTGKIEATLKSQRKRLAAAGEPFLQVDAGYRGFDERGKGIIDSDSWVKVKRSERCESTMKGLVVGEGYRHQGLRLGQIIDVCADKKCKTHFGRAAGTSTTSPDRDRARKAKQEKAFRVTLYQRLRPQLPPPSLKDLAMAIFNRLEHDSVKELCKVRGFEPPKLKRQYGPSVDYHAVGAGIDKMDPLELAQFMNDCLYVRELSVPTWSDAKPERLLAAAKDLGIDTAAVRREVAPKKPAKKTAKKKAAKKIAKTNTPAANKARAAKRTEKLHARAKTSGDSFGAEA